MSCKCTELKELLADMVFAYINKNEEMPHNFEINTLNKACDYLDKNYIGNKYSEDFFKKVKKDINKKEQKELAEEYGFFEGIPEGFFKNDDE